MNTYLKTLALAVVVGTAGTGFAVADQWDKLTTITINEPMQLPTTTLEPGTYVIRLLATSSADRHTVQFFDKDQKHLITTIEAIPNERLRPTGKSVFAFWETPAGQPQALRAWFYPGDNFGQEFAYPKEEASRISARNNNTKVPATSENNVSARNDNNSTPAAPSAEAQFATARSTPVATDPTPAPAPVELAQAQPAPATVDNNSDAQRLNSNTNSNNSSSAANSNTNSSTNEAPASLPQTASSLPLFALIGILSMVAAFALKFAYNRS